MSIASHGHPYKNAPSGPLLVQSLQPIQSRGSTRIFPNGSCSGSGTQNMHSATGQYSTQAGEPEHPVHISLMTATMCGLRFRRVFVPSEIGSYLITSPFTNGATSGVMSATQPPGILIAALIFIGQGREVNRLQTCLYLVTVEAPVLRPRFAGTRLLPAPLWQALPTDQPKPAFAARRLLSVPEPSSQR